MAAPTTANTPKTVRIRFRIVTVPSRYALSMIMIENSFTIILP